MVSPSVPTHSASDPSPPSRDEAELLRLVAEGHLRVLERAVSDTRADPLFVALILADARARMLELELWEIDELRQRVAASPRQEEFGLWLDVIVAERAFLDVDHAGAELAAAALERLPAGAFLPPLLLYTRARLARQLAFGRLMTPTADGTAEVTRLEQEAIADFLRCGYVIEASVTAALVAGVRAQVNGDDPRGAQAVIEVALTQFEEVEPSIWHPVLQQFRCASALQNADLAGYQDAVAQIRRAPLAHPVASTWADFFEALLGAVAGGAQPEHLARIDRTIQAASQLSPRYPAMFRGFVAHALADLGRPEAARYVNGLFGAPLTHDMNAREAALLQLRVAAIDGHPPTCEAILEHLEVFVRHGRRRHAAAFALRMAGDLDRLGRADGAAALRRWGEQHLPPPAERTVLEQAWLAAGPTTNPLETARTDEAPARAAATVEIRVLEPALVVTVDGARVAPRPSGATLLVALAAAHPRPLHVEEAADMLWPDAPLEVSRGRLSTVVYRLRGLLGSAVIQRDGDLLRLDADACTVDLFDFRRRLRGTPDERAAALREVRGTLCDAQLPYVDRLARERDALRALWCSAAEAAHRSQLVTLEDLGPARAALGVDDLAA